MQPISVSPAFYFYSLPTFVKKTISILFLKFSKYSKVKKIKKKILQIFFNTNKKI